MTPRERLVAEAEGWVRRIRLRARKTPELPDHYKADLAKPGQGYALDANSRYAVAGACLDAYLRHPDLLIALLVESGALTNIVYLTPGGAHDTIHALGAPEHVAALKAAIAAASPNETSEG